MEPGRANPSLDRRDNSRQSRLLARPRPKRYLAVAVIYAMSAAAHVARAVFVVEDPAATDGLTEPWDPQYAGQFGAAAQEYGLNRTDANLLAFLYAATGDRRYGDAARFHPVAPSGGRRRRLSQISERAGHQPREHGPIQTMHGGTAAGQA